MTETSVLIVEHGGSWLDWARSLRKAGHVLVLVAQQQGEALSAFFERAQRRIDRLSREADNLKRVVLIPGVGSNGSTLFARAHAVRALLSRLRQQAPRTKLFLDGGAKDGSASLGMQAIADAVMESVGHTASNLRLASGPSFVPQHASRAALLATA